MECSLHSDALCLPRKVTLLGKREASQQLKIQNYTTQEIIKNETTLDYLFKILNISYKTFIPMSLYTGASFQNKARISSQK